MHQNPLSLFSSWRPLLMALVALGVMTSMACGDDFGTECTLPDNEVVRDACSSSDADVNQSCVVENIIQCDSRVCGVFRGSAGFCTKRCSGEEDTSCPSSAFCAEFVVGTGEFFCVKEEFRGR